MFSGQLAHLTPGNVAYLALALFAFFAFALTLAFTVVYSDIGLPKSGRPLKTTKAVRPSPTTEEHKKAA